MAKLEASQRLELLNFPANGEALKRAQNHDARMRLHCEPILNMGDIGPALGHFRSFVEELLPGDKFKTFWHLLSRTPIPTVGVNKGIYNELKPVFDAQDKYIKIDFENPELEIDFENYRKEVNDFKFWKTEGLRALRTAPNTVLLIDAPKQELDKEGNVINIPERPEPYYNLLHIDRIHDIKEDRDGNCEYIIHQEGNKLYYFIDEVAYYVYERVDHATNHKDAIDQDKENFALIETIPHDYGFCPAKYFWTKEGDSIERFNHLSDSLGWLDWLLFLQICERHLETYAGFPIVVTYESKCDYTDEDTGESCNNGVIATYVRSGLIAGNDDGTGVQIPQERVMQPCPACGNSKDLAGPGSKITVPGMADKDDPNMIDAVRIVPADIASLDRLKDKIKELAQFITYNAIGKSEDPINDQAINEKQVMGSFESRQTVLMDTKEGFETIHKFGLDALALFRYGPNIFDSEKAESTVNYGRDFLLQSVEQLTEIYQKSVISGLPAFELDSQRGRIFETKYKNNPELRERVRILSNLEPYLDSAVASVQMMPEASPEDKMLKLKFNTYVRKFEREVMNVVPFMKFVDFDKKIAFIEAKIMEYVAIDVANIPEPEEPEKNALSKN